MHNKAFNNAKISKCNGYQRGLAPMIYKLFDKKNAGVAVKNENMLNKQLSEELHKPIIRIFF